MGEYYLWANVDKKEYIEPSDFGHGSKRHESIHRECEILAALRELLSNEWSGCQVVWIGEYVDFPEKDDTGIFSKLKEQAKELPYSSLAPYDIIMELYINVAGCFKTAEETVREEIGYYLMKIERGNFDDPNYYGIDANNPYNGLFTRSGKNYKYIINYSKGISYSLEETDVCYRNGDKCDFVDPLPILMGYGENVDTGEWFGDIIGGGNELPEGITLLKKVSLDW